MARAAGHAQAQGATPAIRQAMDLGAPEWAYGADDDAELEPTPEPERPRREHTRRPKHRRKRAGWHERAWR